jgi:hypothetical protein
MSKVVFAVGSFTLLSAFMLAGCGHTSAVVPIGGGTFMISKSEWGIQHTGSTVKADALKEASEYCAGMHRELEIVSATQNDMVPFKSEAQAEIEFRCK